MLVGAACHAGWNAFLKIKLEPFTAMALIAIMSAIVVLPVIPFVGIPRAEAWPWIVASVVCHLGYFIGLTEAYRTGDMGQVYPIARGSAPLMTAIVSTVFVGEAIGLRGWIGILVLVSGVFLLSIRGGRGLHFDKRAVAFALFTAVTICGYSIVDGLGARAAQTAHVYTVWLFLLDGLMMLVFALLRHGPPVLGEFAGFWKAGLVGGALSLASYCDRDLGHDGRTDRAGRGAARDQRPVRRRHRGRHTEGAAAAPARHRGADDRQRLGADQAAVTALAAILRGALAVSTSG